MTNVMLNDEMLSEEQLKKVSGGSFIGVSAVIAAVGIIAKSADNTARSLRETVHSFEYQRMSNLDKEKAIGKILANSVAFNSAISGIAGIAGMGVGGLIAVGTMQVKFRKFGVSKEVREFVEKTF